MSKEDIIKCFLDCKGEDNGFQLTLTNKTIDVIANEIERLNKKIENLEKINNANYQSFIEKNKIIIELEKEIDDFIINYKANDNADKKVKKAYELGVKDCARDIKYKLEELKGADKE